MIDAVQRAVLELERRKRLASAPAGARSTLEALRFDPVRYLTEKLGCHPWAGDGEHPGQLEVLQHYERALRQLHERNDWEQGLVATEDLRYWHPGETIQNRIRLEAGHTVGKTWLLAKIVSHFFDTCTPSIVYTFAPTSEQINDLLWKEIRTDREGRGLPGRVLEGRPAINYKSDHFARGRATSNSSGKGTERVQGQHGKYLMFVLDEAEGIDDFVWNSIESMSSGGIAIVLMAANPRTRLSEFHKQRLRPDVKNFQISCLHHPNVVAGREVVPNAVRRDYVLRMIDQHCRPSDEADPDRQSFTVPFDVGIGEQTWPAGTHLVPNAEFMFRVLGVAPVNITDNTLIPIGRYTLARDRGVDDLAAESRERDKVRIGIDSARYGSDMGTIYCRHDGQVWREKQIAQSDGYEYYVVTKELLREMASRGVRDAQVRVDAGGGFSSTVTDNLNHDPDVTEWFDEFEVIEVHFNGAPYSPESYDDFVTEMYADAAESLLGVVLVNPTDALEADLTERTYKWVNRRGRAVKKLTDKEQFRKDKGRSPDDGDGFVLCVCSDHLFDTGVSIARVGG